MDGQRLHNDMEGSDKYCFDVLLKGSKGTQSVISRL